MKKWWYELKLELAFWQGIILGMWMGGFEWSTIKLCASYKNEIIGMAKMIDAGEVRSMSDLDIIMRDRIPELN